MAGSHTQINKPREKSQRVMVPALIIRPSSLHGIYVWVIMPPASPMVEGLGSGVNIWTQAAAHFTAV
jgi:hypothetical protein